MKHYFRGQRLAVMYVLLGILLAGAVSIYAATTIGTDISTDGSLIVTGTAGMGTTTVTNLISSNTSTSTFAGGIDVSTGCFSINGSCVSGGGGGGVSSFNSRSGAVIPAAGDYSSVKLGDFLATIASGGTQLVIADGTNQFGVVTGGTFTFAAGFGSGDFIVYYAGSNFQQIHMSVFGADPTKVSASGSMVVDPDQTALYSDYHNVPLYIGNTDTDLLVSLQDWRPTNGVIARARIFGAGPGLAIGTAQDFNGFPIPQYSVEPNGPTGLWQKWNVTVNGPNFDITAPDGSVTSVAIDAAMTQDVIFAPDISPDAFVEFAQFAPNSFFEGVTTLTGVLSVGGAPNFITTPMDLKFGGPTFAVNTNFGPVIVTGGFGVGLTSTGQNLDQLTAGSLDIWVKYSVLP